LEEYRKKKVTYGDFTLEGVQLPEGFIQVNGRVTLQTSDKRSGIPAEEEDAFSYYKIGRHRLSKQTDEQAMLNKTIDTFSSQPSFSTRHQSLETNQLHQRLELRACQAHPQEEQEEALGEGH